MKNLTAEEERGWGDGENARGAAWGKVRIAPLQNGLSAAATARNSLGNTSFDFSRSCLHETFFVIARHLARRNYAVIPVRRMLYQRSTVKSTIFN